MDRKLGDVEKLPAGTAQDLLGIDQPIIDDEDPEVDSVPTGAVALAPAPVQPSA
jgi:hypothetical protein